MAVQTLLFSKYGFVPSVVVEKTFIQQITLFVVALRILYLELQKRLKNFDRIHTKWRLTALFWENDAYEAN